MATLKNTTINDTGYIQIPIGSTAERPVTPLGGMMRYNTTLGYIEWWDATNSLWRPIYQIPSLQIEYLVVGGGAGGSGGTAGGGGTSATVNTGGGGGGGWRYADGTGGNGGSGIVIIRYADTFPAATSTTGNPVITVSGGYRIYKWISSGTITF